MMPAWHQLVSMSGHLEESETARKLQLYATSIYPVHSFVCQLDYEGARQSREPLFLQTLSPEDFFFSERPKFQNLFTQRPKFAII